MIKKEMVFKNTCEECGHEWITEIGAEVENICPSCKKGPEDSKHSIEDTLSPEDMLKILKSLIEKKSEKDTH